MNETNETDKLLFALSYPIGLIGLILILTRKDDHDARYHGFNSLFFWIAVMIVDIVLGMTFILALLTPLVSLAALIYSIILAVQVYKGETPEIPIITQFASKYVDQA
jgi:uncharacterized membrane protein